MSVLKIVHSTRFDYDAPISSSYNEARLTPVWLPRQRVLSSRMDISPLGWRTTYRDYWGTDVIAFEILEPHSSLEVVSTSEVEVGEALQAKAPLSWDSLVGPVFQDLFAEFLAISDATQPTPELAEMAQRAAREETPDAAAQAVCAYLYDVVSYVPGSTTVHSSAAHAWETKSGVCQDFAHLAIGALRSIGIPARYVSGYLHPNPDAATGETVRGESHAWVEWWSGDWRGFDPTNNQEVGESHVIVARAREYSDVPPLSGVFAGRESALTVTVDVTRLS